MKIKDIDSFINNTDYLPINADKSENYLLI